MDLWIFDRPRAYSSGTFDIHNELDKLARALVSYATMAGDTMDLDHTYRHDLRLFFYVLLWMCARQAWSNEFAGKQNPPKDSLLRTWEFGIFKYMADAKRGHMTVDGLGWIMGEFPETLDVVKPLYLKIRNILFPFDKNWRMSLGTPIGDLGQLYNPIIAALNEAINEV
ncbi:serine/threonine-protein kinase Sgk2 [Ceratocystis lukuohia]|uniref:Serine/threonine-protein kinase Sgk2 n=1 Tax=Ceratocystis lukuohia TaxID=2019550 RepID=A0ABR4MDZ8_9PEZI